jgi:hypothetical protein
MIDVWTMYRLMMDGWMVDDQMMDVVGRSFEVGQR